MDKSTLDLFMVLATVKRDGHVLIGKTDIGEVRHARFNNRHWFAYPLDERKLKPTDHPAIGFRTRREAVRALIEASEDVLAKAKADYEKERRIGS